MPARGHDRHAHVMSCMRCDSMLARAELKWMAQIQSIQLCQRSGGSCACGWTTILRAPCRHPGSVAQALRQEAASAA